MRILHLIDPASPGGGACTLRLLAEPMRRLTNVHQDALIIGHAGHAALAKRCGVEPIGRVCPPGNLAVLARRGLRRWARSFESAFGSYDLVHAWTESTAALAAVAGPPRPALATLSIGPVGSASMISLRRAVADRPMPLLATSIGVRREHVVGGIAPGLISVLPPAVDPAAIHGEDRQALRRRWGVDESTLVVALMSEPVAWADALATITMIMTVAVAGMDVRLLVHPAAQGRLDAQRLIDQCSRNGSARRIAGRSGERLSSRLMILEEWLAEPWRIVAGVDAALMIGSQMDVGAGDQASLARPTPGGWGRWIGEVSALMRGLTMRPRRPMPGVMPLRWAMAAGVPVVSELGDALAGIIDDGSSGLLVRPFDRMAAVDRLLRLASDRSIGHRLGAAARMRSSEQGSRSTYCVRLREAYEHVLAGQSPAIQTDGQSHSGQAEKGS